MSLLIKSDLNFSPQYIALLVEYRRHILYQIFKKVTKSTGSLISQIYISTGIVTFNS